MVKKRKPMRFKIFVFLILSVLVIGAINLIKIGQNFLGYGELEIQKIATIDYDQDPKCGVHPFKENIIVYYKNSLKGYSLEGIEKWSIAKKVSKPVIRTSEEFVFLADKETGEITAFGEQGAKVWTVNFKKAISNMICNKQGFIVLYFEGEKNGEIHVLSPQGKETGKIMVSNGTLIDMTIAENDDSIAISVMDLENNKLETKVVLYSKEGKLLGGNQYEDQIISNLFFSEDNRLMQVGDSKLMAFSKEKGLLWSKDVSSSINRVCWNKKGFIMVNIINNNKSIMDTKNRNYISIIDINGSDIGQIPIKGEILGMDSQGNNGVVFTDRTVYFILKQGKQVVEKKINNDIQSVYMLSDQKLMLVLKNKLEVVQVKYKEK